MSQIFLEVVRFRCHDLPKQTETGRNGPERTKTDRNGLTKIPKRTSRSTETGLNKGIYLPTYLPTYLHTYIPAYLPTNIYILLLRLFLSYPALPFLAGSHWSLFRYELKSVPVRFGTGNKTIHRQDNSSTRFLETIHRHNWRQLIDTFWRQFIDTLLCWNYTQADKMKTMFWE